MNESIENPVFEISPDDANLVFAGPFKGRSVLWVRTLNGDVSRPFCQAV